jgi:hypothetical protein
LNGKHIEYWLNISFEFIRILLNKVLSTSDT